MKFASYPTAGRTQRECGIVCNPHKHYKERPECMVPSETSCAWPIFAARRGEQKLMIPVKVSIVPRHRQLRRAHPVDEAARRSWRRAPFFTKARRLPRKMVKRKRSRRRERAEAKRPRGSVGDPETSWYPVKFFLPSFSFKKKKVSRPGMRSELFRW